MAWSLARWALELLWDARDRGVMMYYTVGSWPVSTFEGTIGMQGFLNVPLPRCCSSLRDGGHLQDPSALDHRLSFANFGP